MDEVVLALEGAIAPMECFVDDRGDGPACCARTRPTTATAAPPSCCGRASRAASSGRCSSTTLAELVEFSVSRDDARRSAA